MASLGPAHRGYDYQDLLTAIRLVDVLLDSVVQVHIDQKLVLDDRFDDLTTVDVAGRRERVQFKHSETDDRPLSLDTFSSDARGLRIDRLFASAIADREKYSTGYSEYLYRVVLRDAEPEDVGLRELLEPAMPDPGPFVAGMQTKRMRFNPRALWPPASQKNHDDMRKASTRLSSSLQHGETRMSREDLGWVCSRW